MRKMLWAPSFFAATCLVTVGLAAQAPVTDAQDPSAQTPSTQAPATPAPRTQAPSRTAPAEGAKVTLSGCIERQSATQTAGAAGAASMPFALTGAMASGSAPVGTSGAAQAAKTYRLDATDSVVSPHVGHKVEITGTIQQQPSANASATASGAAAGASVNAPIFKVDSLKMVAATCQ